MMDAAQEDGRKLAIFGDSFGTPEVAEWKLRIPALRHAMKNGHVVTLNQYGRRNPDKTDGNFRVADDIEYIWNGGRHILFYDAVPADCRPLLIIGEAGASNSSITQPFAVDDGIKYSDRLAREKYGDRILFISLYTLGRWRDCQLDGQIPAAESLLWSRVNGIQRPVA
jgi:hypothetical protein